MHRAALARTRAQMRPVLAVIGGLLIALASSLSCVSPGQAETMSSALARAYAGNPDLNQQRAGVRATDENLPRASAAWRPTATATGQYGYNYFDLTAPVSSGAAAVGVAVGAPITSGSSRLRQATDPGSLGLTVTRNLFNGNRTVNGARYRDTRSAQKQHHCS
jgi:outer membrane protein